MGGYAYLAPTSAADALAALNQAASAGTRTQMLAGGTDVLVQMRSTDKGPRTFVDVKHIAEANELRIDADEVFVGAAIASAELNENAELKSILPGLIESADLIGSTQIQGRATIGGNLCNSSPAGDTIPALIACGAVCVIASPDGNREVSTEDFVTGVGTNVLQPTEFLVGLQDPATQGQDGRRLPALYPTYRDGHRRVRRRRCADLGRQRHLHRSESGHRRRGDHCAARPDAAAALMGTKVDDAALAAAAAASSALARPITDKRGTVEYRKKVVGVLTKRAGAIARDRAAAR